MVIQSAWFLFPCYCHTTLIFAKVSQDFRKTRVDEVVLCFGFSWGVCLFFFLLWEVFSFYRRKFNLCYKCLHIFSSSGNIYWNSVEWSISNFTMVTDQMLNERSDNSGKGYRDNAVKCKNCFHGMTTVWFGFLLCQTCMDGQELL